MSHRDNVDLEAARDRLPQRIDDEKSTLRLPKTQSQEDFVGEMGKLAGCMLKRIKTAEMPRYLSWKESLCRLFVGSKSYRGPFVVIPLVLAWASHFKSDTWGNTTTFALCFIAMIPLQKFFHLAGEELEPFLKEELRDLLIITLSNAMEAALAMILLFKCQLRLLQSTIIGVVLLHLLLIPGIAFFIQGVQVPEQKLKRPFLSLNLSLLMIGVLGIVTPTAFFAALDRGSVVTGSGSQSGLPPQFVPLVSDSVRQDILQMSRGISVMLLVIYITGCLYRQHIVPVAKQRDSVQATRRDNIATPIVDKEHVATPYSASTNTSLACHVDSASTSDTFKVCSPSAIQSSHSLHPIESSRSDHGVQEQAKDILNPWVCVVLLIAAVALMSVTAEFLVESIEVILEITDIQTEWFGLILLPILSFSADGAVIIWKYTREFSCGMCEWAFAKWIRRKGSADTPPSNHSPRALSGASLEGPTAGIPQVNVVHPSGNANSRPTPLDLHASMDGATAVPDQTSSTINPSVRDLPVESVRAGEGREDGDEGDSYSQAQKKADEAPQAPQGSPDVPEFAHGRPIDLSIQFTLWWTPFLVLLGWWTDRPMHLLFDYFEVGMLLGACFLVNYVTVDEKTNMSEGLTMISFYAMIAAAAWFYPGQPQVAFMLSCPGTVADAVALGPEGTGENLIKLLE